jgi:hypothetical protein
LDQFSELFVSPRALFVLGFEGQEGSGVNAYSHIEFAPSAGIEEHRRYKPENALLAPPSRPSRIVYGDYVKPVALLLVLIAFAFVASPTAWLIAGAAALCIAALLTSVCLWVQNNVR